MSQKANLTRRQFLVGASATLAGLLIPPRQRLVPVARAIGQTAPSIAAGIVADHTVVDQYQNIPQQYIDLVKQMWVQVIGESHSGAYRYGVNLLAAQDAKFPAIGQAGYQNGGIPYPLDTVNPKLRVSRIWWYDDPLDSEGIKWYRFGGGEEDFWTTPWAVDNVKTNITYCNGAGNIPVAAVGFGWCWDMLGAGGTADPVFGCRWGGRSYYWNGTNFTNAYYWGLDDDDNALVDPSGTRENVVNCNDYINAVVEINSHDANTVCFFTTGPVDSQSGTTSNEGESGYQRYLKHEHIRQYVQAHGGFLLDFADILSHNDAGVQHTTTWNGHEFPLIHPDNDGEYNGAESSCHISEAGCLRIAKALWWMLAHIAGWEAVADTQAPTSPGSLTATAVSSTQVDLGWNPATDDVGVVGYRIYRDSALAGTSATTSFSDVGLVPDTPYSYTVTARDAAGNESGSSNVATATTPDVPSYEVFIPIVSK